ncbi:hypothetical protein VTN02DRAFT_667 [Thermoascus thermophilus]
MSQVRRRESDDGRQPKLLPLSPTSLRGHPSPHSPLSAHLIPRDYLGQRPDGQPPRPANVPAANPRRPTPSPLHTSFRPRSPRRDGLKASPLSPRTPKSTDDSALADPESLSGRLEYPTFPTPPGSVSASWTAGPVGYLRMQLPERHPEHAGNMNDESSQSQPRKISDAASSSLSTRSPSSSPVSSLPSITGDRPGQRTMPRTSSIDSAISSLSSASYSQKSSFDSNALSPADINNLISAAGSVEALIVHLLKEKHHATSQNAQLWRLVDKQRALVLGLNKDLERALKDKERYRKKVKELQSQATSALPATESQAAPSAAPTSSDPSGGDESGTPRLSQDVAAAPGGPAPLGDSQPDATKSHVRNLTEDTGMVPAPLHVLHAQTESFRSSPDAPNPDSPPSDDRSATANVRHTDSSVSSHQDENVAHQRALPARATENSLNGHSSAFHQERAAVSYPPSPVERHGSTVGGARGLPDTQDKMTPPSRKPPPAPLDLRRAERASMQLQQAGPVNSDSDYDRHQGGPANSDSEYDDVSEVDEIPTVERGRRRTREEDDREREAAMMREQEARSRSSKKKTKPTKATEGSEKPHAAAVGLPSSPRQMVPQSPPLRGIGHISEPESLSSVLNPQNAHAEPLGERLVVSPPMSPGLPVSPRPVDRPIGSPLPRMPREGSGAVTSPPLSPRNGMPGLPLSPRALKYPVSLPHYTLVSAAPQPTAKTNGYVSSPIHGEAASRPIPSIDAAIKIDSPHSPRDVQRGIYQGLVSDDYPGLLLPPNALPSVEVKVSSSRLRPSRNSYTTPKPSEDDPVFTLGVFSRADRSELWRVEKAIPALPQLDQQLRQVLDFPGKLPDRSIFSGHSPAKVDARRAALNAYFDILLDTPMDETAALIICRFLTADAIEPRDDEMSLVKANGKISPEILRGPGGKPRKEGYLTKRGKNFGGWKARYFVLHGPELKYYESPGGPHLGTIKIYNAQIGKQSQNTGAQTQSPSIHDDDSDNQYRHAFLILEPKKKDSSALVRHVLCAESDEERDAWVDALLQYVERDSSEDETPNAPSSRGQSQTHGKHASSTTNKSRLLSGGSKRSGKGADSPDQDPSDTIQGFSYDNAVAAEPPVHGPSSEKDLVKPSPTRSGSLTENLDATNQNHQHGSEQGQSTSHTSKTISGPTNGAVIQDAGAWGNKPATTAKEKKRSIWGFRTRSSSDLASQIQGGSESSANARHLSSSIERKGPVRAVFGMPLAEAVQFCPPQGVGVDVELPAVVYRCIEYLRAKEAESEEGIFRLSGSNVVVKALKERFNTEGDVDFLAGDHYYDVHAIASLFKQYLRELPTTVLTRELHLDFLRVLELDERQKKIAAFNALVHKLPKPNLALLRALSQFLIVIVNNSDINKMTVRNVGIVFAPTLNIPAPVFSMFLTDFDSIFGEMPDSSTKTTELTVDQSLAPEDIRSPRHQMFSDLPTPAYNQASFQGPGDSAHRLSEDLKATYDTGFTPMQPTCEQRHYGLESSNQRPVDSTQGSSNRMQASNMDGSHSSKARRRESSLLLMDLGHRKTSFQKLRDDQALVAEESAFE